MPSITCPHCDSELRVKSADLGRKIRCPECDKRFVASEDDEDDGDEVRASRDDREERRPRRKAASGLKMPSCLTGCFLLFGVVGCLGLVGFLSGDRGQAGKPNGGADQAAAEQQRQEEARRQQEGAQAKQERAAEKGDAGRIKANRNLSREEFRLRVTGMDPNALIDFIGRPDSTQDTEDGDYWYYSDVAVDPATGKRSFQVQIVWGNNSVREVNFN